VYVVQRRWSIYGPAARVEGVFTERSAAEDCRLRSEKTLWPTLRPPYLWAEDPHTSSDPPALTDFALPIFLDWLRDGNIPLPADPESARDWHSWWEVQRNRLTPEQLSHLFAALHHLTFHEIVEVDLITEDGWDPLRDVSEQTGVALTGQWAPNAEGQELPPGEQTPGSFIPNVDENDIPF
jgi:hypothetical protein